MKKRYVEVLSSATIVIVVTVVIALLLTVFTHKKVAEEQQVSEKDRFEILHLENKKLKDEIKRLTIRIQDIEEKTNQNSNYYKLIQSNLDMQGTLLRNFLKKESIK